MSSASSSLSHQASTGVSADGPVRITDRDEPLYAEDLLVGDVYELGTTCATEAEIIDFARRFDPLPIHIDPTAAAAGPFAGIIGSASHSMALYSSVASAVFVSQLALVAGKGVERLRFPNPLRPDAVLTASIEILDVTPRFRGEAATTDRADLRCRGQLTEADGRPVLTMEPLQVIRYRVPQRRA
ncbi:MaoC/PaaZ C-terminal domain-containing protein [Gordonia sp. (in: high G+C Gram-positive bacteria)]|uniref:MaoC/PaaZ C-terminal domain-containing protein n=1 Tax=Gordonia sp. (in: high G+C Gram-positive bacteria) TaxID=84139 RepID=UPI003F99AA5C